MYVQEEEEDTELVESLTQSCSNAANIENRPNRPSFVFDSTALDEVDSGRKSPLEGNEGRVSPINPVIQTKLLTVHSQEKRNLMVSRKCVEAYCGGDKNIVTHVGELICVLYRCN